MVLKAEIPQSCSRRQSNGDVKPEYMVYHREPLPLVWKVAILIDFLIGDDTAPYPQARKEAMQNVDIFCRELPLKL